MNCLEMRNLLMSQRGWCRRVATLAARIYLRVDSADSINSVSLGDHGRSILSEGEYRMICLHGSGTIRGGL
jgi:hypothetical protein